MNYLSIFSVLLPHAHVYYSVGCFTDTIMLTVRVLTSHLLHFDVLLAKLLLEQCQRVEFMFAYDHLLLARVLGLAPLVDTNGGGLGCLSCFFKIFGLCRSN